jgi:hypothetical protein
MAAVTKASDAHIDANTAKKAGHLAGDFIAGENLAACDFCYIKASDGLVYKTTGATLGGENSRCAGITPKAVLAGQVVDLLSAPLVMRYAASGLSPGALLFLSTAGGLDTAATTGDTTGIAQAINATDIRIVRFI